MKFTTGAMRVATPPMKSVLQSIVSRSEGRVSAYLMRAAWMMSPILTSLGQATSHRLQLRQYFSASS